MKKSLTQLFLVISLCFLLCFSISCQNQEAMAELEKFRAQAEVEEQNKELTREMWEAWGKGEFEAYKEFVAPDFFYYFPSISTKPMSREETIEFGKMLRNAFPDITFSIEELFAVGDRVIVRIIIRGTHEGEFMGVPATGNKVEGSGILIGRIENGKFVEDREEFDMLGLMQQLGMELKPKEEER